MSHAILPPSDLITLTPTVQNTVQDTVPAAPVVAPAPAVQTTPAPVELFPPANPLETKVNEFFPPAARLWLYGVCVAALPLLVAFGKVSGDQVSLWTDFAASILGVSGLTVAIANVKK